MAKRYLYKLTEQDRTTWNRSTLWGKNVTHEATGSGTNLCSSDVIHAYADKNLALLMNPVHANIKYPVMFLAFGEVVSQDTFKVGVKRLTTQKEIMLPRWYTGSNRLNVIVRFAQLCAAAAAEAAEATAAEAAAATAAEAETAWVAAWVAQRVAQRVAAWAAARVSARASKRAVAAWAAARVSARVAIPDFSALAVQAIKEAASGEIKYY